MTHTGPICPSELGSGWIDAGTLSPNRSRPPVPLGSDPDAGRPQHAQPPGLFQARSAGATTFAAQNPFSTSDEPVTARKVKEPVDKSASRPFAFNQAAKAQARIRQGGKCACCGEGLDDLEENAHHVFPNQSGVGSNPQHAWLASAENCVVLCEGCHHRVHQDGRYRAGAVAPPSYYAHSHLGNPAAHQGWVNQLLQKGRSLWP